MISALKSKESDKIMGVPLHEWVAGPDDPTTFKEAKSWVQSLNIDGGGWRMPTEAELNTLYKIGTGYRNMTSLLKTSGWIIWAVDSKGSSLARRFSFNRGGGWNDPYSSGNDRAFAVRSQTNSQFGKKPTQVGDSHQSKGIGRDGRFIAYDDGTVLDTKTDLMWAAKDDGKGVMEGALKEYFQNYKVGGYEDWRLPTVDELETLYNPEQKNSKGYHITKFIEIGHEWIWASE